MRVKAEETAASRAGDDGAHVPGSASRRPATGADRDCRRRFYANMTQTRR